MSKSGKIYKIIIILLIVIAVIFSYWMLQGFFLVRQVEKAESVFKLKFEHCRSLEEKRDECFFEQALNSTHGILTIFYEDFCKGIENLELRDFCLNHSLSIEVGLARTCEGLKNQDLRDLCIYHSSINMNNIWYCQNISNNILKEVCYSDVLSQKEKLISDCENQSRYDPACFTWLAVRLLDVGICYKQDTEYKIIDCIEKVALMLKNDTICEKITNQEFRDNCISEVAAVSKNLALCNKIKENTRRELCISSVAVEKEDSKLCTTLSTTNLQDDCFVKLAIKKNSSDLCDKVVHNRNRDNCFLEIAKSTKNSDICINIEDISKREFCGKVASDDPEQCNRYPQESAQDLCLENLALKVQDPEICLKIKEKSKKYYCVREIVRKNPDPELCEKYIGEESIDERDLCLEIVAQKSKK